MLIHIPSMVIFIPNSKCPTDQESCGCIFVSEKDNLLNLYPSLVSTPSNFGVKCLDNYFC